MATTRRVGAYTQAWHGIDTSWMRRGACSTTALTAEQKRNFFADNRRGVIARRDELAAKKFCWVCPVKGACLDYALAGGMQGIWGGLTEKERDEILVVRRRAV